MEDLFALSVSSKEKDFINVGLKMDMEVSADVLSTFADVPYLGSLIKLGILANKYQDLRFIRKVAKFLDKQQDISEEKKVQFLGSLNENKRRMIHDYLMHYLLRAEDEEKADIMGFIYKERVCGFIDDEMFLRLCSIVDKAFVFDLSKLKQLSEKNEVDSVAINSFVNLGLIDNDLGGVWHDKPQKQLNKVGLLLSQILDKNGWYSR